MRHGRKVNHLSRKSEHRKAMLSNMATSLILHKRITTTVAKAKALRKYVEPLLTKAKDDSTHNRRVVFSYLKQKEPIIELFSNVADKIADRPGGYTRIIKTGTRLGDNAEMCMMELVDFNELMLQDKTTKTRRGRRKKKKSDTETPATETPAAKAAATETAATETAATETEETAAETEETPPSENTGTDNESDDTKKSES